MSSMKKGLRRVAVAAVATLVVAPALATVASATSTFAFDRLQGNDRYITSAKVADAFGTSTSVILANGTNAHTVDALAAAYLAGAKHAPILLTTLDTTPTDVIAAITKTGATTVYLAGETGAISAAQATALDATFGTVTRLGGSDRFATAKKLIAEAGAAGTAKTAIVTTGMDFPDALGAGPLSYVKGMPIGITWQNSLPADTLAALKGAGVTNAIVLGGPTVVSQNVLNSLVANGISLSTAAGVTAGRIYGADRAETSSKLADFEITTQGFSNTGVNVATGDKTVAGAKGADALGGAALSGKENRPTLITNSATAPGAGVLAFLTAHANTLTAGHIYGGFGPVTAAAELLMTNAAKAVTSNQTYSVTPTAATSKTISIPGGTAAEKIQGNVQYTASGLGTTAVRIALVKSSDITTTGNVVTFKATTAGTADLTPALVGDITVVNGVGHTGMTALATPVSGSVTFTVDSDTAGSAQPVVFSNADANATLSVDANLAPTEAFGIGGVATWLPVEAAAGNITPYSPITSVNKAASYFISSGGSSDGLYNYDSNDTFFINDVPATMAQFVAVLSTGDTFGGTYTDNPALSSAFYLDNVSPTAPATMTFSAITTSTTTVNWTVPSSGVPDTYNVYRAATTAPAPVTDVSGYTKVGTVAGDATALKFVNTGLAAGTTYYYAVTAVVDGDESAPITGSQATTGASTATPYSTAAVFIDNSSTANHVVNAGDVARVQFDGVVTVAPTASITVIDNDGTTATITCGTTAVCTTSGTTSTLLTLTFSIAPTPTDLGTDGVLGSVKTEVLDATGISNAFGAWNLARSGQAGAFNRVIGGVNTDMPAALATGKVVADDSLNNVVIAGTAGPTTGDTVNVYNANGVLLGTGTYDSTTGVTITGMTSVAGTTVYVTYVDATSGYESITFAATVVA